MSAAFVGIRNRQGCLRVRRIGAAKLLTYRSGMIMRLMAGSGLSRSTGLASGPGGFNGAGNLCQARTPGISSLANADPVLRERAFA
jgi:hypothetical protein